MQEAREILAEKIISACHYSRQGAYSLAEKILMMPTELRNAAIDFLKSGRMKNFSAEGFTVKDIMRVRGFNYLNALNVTAWLMRDPKTARNALSEPVYSVKGSAEL